MSDATPCTECESCADCTCEDADDTLPVEHHVALDCIRTIFSTLTEPTRMLSAVDIIAAAVIDSIPELVGQEKVVLEMIADKAIQRISAYRLMKMPTEGSA